MVSTLLAMNDSLSAPMTFSMEVEPSVATVPVIAVLVLSSLVLSAFASVLVSFLLPQAARARVSTAASSSAMIFFMFITSLCFLLFGCSVYNVSIPPVCKEQKRGGVKSV